VLCELTALRRPLYTAGGEGI